MSETNPDYLIYEPAPEKPEGFDKRIEKIVGLCPNNTDPYIRFVWGMDATEKFGENLVPRYPDPDDKYVGLPFWVIEGWQSPDVYDRAEWELHKEVLGEFPNRGVWDFIEVYRTPDYRMIPLGEGAFKKAYEWKIWKSKPKPRAVADLLEYRNLTAELKDARWEMKKEEIFNQFAEDYDKAAIDGNKNADFSKNILTGKNVGNFRQRQSGLFVPNNTKNFNN